LISQRNRSFSQEREGAGATAISCSKFVSSALARFEESEKRIQVVNAKLLTLMRLFNTSSPPGVDSRRFL
jgi:hypothetical protein